MRLDTVRPPRIRRRRIRLIGMRVCERVVMMSCRCSTFEIRSACRNRRHLPFFVAVSANCAVRRPHRRRATPRGNPTARRTHGIASRTGRPSEETDDFRRCNPRRAYVELEDAPPPRSSIPRTCHDASVRSPVSSMPCLADYPFVLSHFSSPALRFLRRRRESRLGITHISEHCIGSRCGRDFPQEEVSC